MKLITNKLLGYLATEQASFLFLVREADGLISAETLRKLIDQLTVDQEGVQKRFDFALRENERKLKDKELEIREIETHVACEQKNLDDTNRQIAELRQKLLKFSG